MITIKESFNFGKRGDIEYILEKLLNRDRVFIHLNPDFQFESKKFFEIIELYKKNYPLEYIFKEVFFYGEKFYIEDGVLIPRDDTEILIDIVKSELKYYVKFFKEKKETITKKDISGKKIVEKRAGTEKNFFKSLQIAEIGVGSGVISIILSKLLKEKYNLKFLGTDINRLAIEITSKNANLHNVEIELYHTNLLDGIDKKIDILISNPPYVEESWNFEPLKYEPKEAIFAKDNGTYLLKEIVKLAIKKEVKLLICEMGYNQKELMENFFITLKLNNYYFYKDLANNYRGFVIKFI